MASRPSSWQEKLQGKALPPNDTPAPLTARRLLQSHLLPAARLQGVL